MIWIIRSLVTKVYKKTVALDGRVESAGRGGRRDEEEGGTRRKEKRGGRRKEEGGGTRRKEERGGTRDEESEKMKKLPKK